MEDLHRQVEMRCPICAGTEFRYDKENENIPVECTNCGQIMTRQELLESNGIAVENTLEEMKSEVLEEFQKKFKDIFKR